MNRKGSRGGKREKGVEEGEERREQQGRRRQEDGAARKAESEDEDKGGSMRDSAASSTLVKVCVDNNNARPVHQPVLGLDEQQCHCAEPDMGSRLPAECRLP